MKLLLNIAICLSFMTAHAQAPDLPISEKTGKAVYSSVVNVADVSVADLHDRTVHWFNAYFKNPGSVIKENNKEGHFVKGQHGMNIFDEIDGNKNKAGLVKYRVEVFAKDGRYKYEVYDIFKLANPKQYLEEWLDDSAPHKEVQFEYARQVDEQIKALIENLTQTLSKPVPGQEVDDW